MSEVHYWTNRPIWPQGIDRPTQLHTPPSTLDWNLWLGPAPDRPYNPAYAPFNWRGWWDFGTGALGDMACHGRDAAFWALELGYPTRVEPETSKLYDETAPRFSRVTYDFPARGSRPPVRVIWRDGGLWPPKPAGLPENMEWPPEEIGGQMWVGDTGALLAGMYGENPRLLDSARDAELKASPPAVKYERSPGVYAEWIRAMKGGAPNLSTFAGHAGPLTEMVLLGCLAVRMGQPIDVDSSTGKVKNAAVPPEWLTPSYRKGWTLRRMSGHLLKVLGVAFGLAVLIGNTINVGILRTPGEVAHHLPSTALFLGVWLAGDIRIAELNETVTNIFEMLGLNHLYRIFPSEQEAILSFREGASPGTGIA